MGQFEKQTNDAIVALRKQHDEVVNSLGELTSAAAADRLVLAKLAEAVQTPIVGRAAPKIMITGLDGGPPAVLPSAPRVGDAVHFYTVESGRQVRGMNAGPYAAIVSRVDGTRLDLMVLSPTRGFYPAFAVEAGDESNLARADTEEEVAGWWQPKA